MLEDGDPPGGELAVGEVAVLLAYASAVREEYGHLSDEEFTTGRIAVLEHLLALPALYRTPEAARLWASRAAANLTAELTLLGRRAASGPATPPSAAG